MTPIGGIATPVISDRPQLRANTLSLMECLGQSIANIAPTLTPALNISVVVGLAGVGSWVGYVIATVGMLFVSANISSLAKRHPVAGSYFVYIGRTFGPFAGLIAGWSMIAAYLFTAVAVVVSVTLFLGNVFTAFGLKGLIPPDWIVACVFTAGVFYAAYRDIRMSSRVGLVLEAISVGIIIIVTAVVVAKHGTVVDPKQLDFGHLDMGSVMSSLAFAVFSFVGFESAATLARETRNPEKTVPLAVTVSCVVVGLFFVVMCYLMVLGTGRRREGDRRQFLAVC
jgi:amino acid transporter